MLICAQLATAAERIHGYEDDAEAHKLVVADRDRLAAELEAANAEKDRLCGMQLLWCTLEPLFN